MDDRRVAGDKSQLRRRIIGHQRKKIGQRKEDIQPDDYFKERRMLTQKLFIWSERLGNKLI